MSHENVELQRRAVDAFNRRDQHEFLALMDDEVDAHSRIVAVEGGYHGMEGIRRWWDDFLGSFPDYTIEVEEARDLGNVVLCRFRARAHGAGSDTPLTDPVWHVTEWRDGKVPLVARQHNRGRRPRSRRAIGVVAGAAPFSAPHEVREARGSDEAAKSGDNARNSARRP